RWLVSKAVGTGGAGGGPRGSGVGSSAAFIGSAAINRLSTSEKWPLCSLPAKERCSHTSARREESASVSLLETSRCTSASLRRARRRSAQQKSGGRAR